MRAQSSGTSRSLSWEEREIDAAAGEAARIGGRAGDEYLDPAERPLAEAGEGMAEGFELAEDDLIEAAETARAWVNPFTPEARGHDVRLLRGGPRGFVRVPRQRQIIEIGDAQANQAAPSAAGDGPGVARARAPRVMGSSTP